MRRLIIFIIVLGFYGCWKSGDDEIFLMPNNYQGAVYIIFNQKKGQPIKYENESRLYEIPQNGILKTQFDLNDGWHSVSKYYYIKNGKRIEIPFQIENKAIKKDTLQVCCVAVGSTSKNNGQDVDYLEFIVGTAQTIDSVSENDYKKNVSSYAE
jgi:hypothetical protein